ncbi:MAG: sensor histidine kinase [Acidobacteriota bacterium]
MALSLGYTVVLALLVCSTIEVYRLQRSLSAREVAVYRQHILRESAISELRDLIWLGSNDARGFFLSGDAPRLQTQICEIEKQGRADLDALPAQAARRFTAFTAALRPVASPELQSRLPGPLQGEQELLPQREEALRALDGVKSQARRELHSAEAVFTRSQASIVWQLSYVLGGSLVVGSATAWLTLRSVRRWQRERARYSEEMGRLSVRLLDTQEEERRFLASELHDEVGQTLTALRMELGSALRATEHPAGRERLRRAGQLAERAIGAVRNISLMLRPALLDDLGLEAALEWHMSEFSKRSGIEARFTACEPVLDLSDDTKTCIYRVAQEALNNCEKYSRASSVGLVLRRSEERLVLEIRDDGIGFDPGARGMHRGGTGLLGIRERVARLGGSILIDTRPGEGVRMVAALPLSAAASRVECGALAL